MAKTKFNGPRHNELRKFLAETERAFCVWQHKPSAITLIEEWFINGRLVIFALHAPDGWDVWLPGAEGQTEHAFAEIRRAVGLEPVVNGIPRTG